MWLCFGSVCLYEVMPVFAISVQCVLGRHMVPYMSAVLKIRTVCHARDLRKLARSCKQLHLLCPPDPKKLPCTALLSGFQSSRELWNSQGKSVLGKCSFTSSKGPVNIWNDHKACKYFLIFDTACRSLLSGVPDFFDRNKILSGGDLSHYQVPHCIRVFFYFVWFVFIHHNFQFYFELCTYCNILDIYLS